MNLGQKLLLLGTSSIPDWVIQQYGPATSSVIAAADLANNQYWVKGSGLQSLNEWQDTAYAAPTSPVPDSSGVYQTIPANTLPRANGTGAQWYGSRTNLFLNSQAPVTQTVTVTSGVSYTVSVIGTASVVLSGAGTGTATQGSPVTITTSSTSLVCTVSGAGGSFQNVQVETGSFPTPPIITAGSAVTVTSPITTLKGPMLAAALAAKGFAGETDGVAGGPNPSMLVFGNDGAGIVYSTVTGNNKPQIYSSSPSSSTIGTLGSGTQASLAKIAAGFSSSGLSIAGNGGSVATTTGPWNGASYTPVILGNDAAGVRPLNGNMLSFAFLDTDATAFPNLYAAP